MASRRVNTRAAASTVTVLGSDENKINPGIGKAGLRATGAAAAPKGKAPTAGAASNAAAACAKRRTALADSSNKVAQPFKGTKGKLGVVAEKAGATGKAASTGVAASTARSLRSSTSKSTAGAKAEDDDGDAVMETTEDRPIKSLRNSGSRTASTALAGKSTNIPKAATTGQPTKNAGLRKSTSASAPVSKKEEPAVKRSTKNAGLRLKREIQEVDVSRVEEEAEVDENHAVALHEDVEPPAGQRRRSKRLRPSDPLENAEASTSALKAEEDAVAAANRSVAETVSRIIESDVGIDVDQDEEVDENAKDYGWEDLDIGDEEDPLMVTEYVREIHDYMKELEITTLADPHYMSRQSEVTWKMRSILVDWLIEVHGKFRLLPETIFLAVNIVDRLLSIRTVSLTKFQLVGIVSLFVASKYEEVICPSVSSFLYMTDGGYTDDEMLSAERYILKQIDFNLSYPNPINFLRRISKADGYDIQTRTVAKYFLEMSCVDRKFISVTPSLIAAAGMWLARKILDRGDWHANLVHYSTYSQLELLPTAQLMLDYVLRRSQTPSDPIEHPHFTKKYSAKKFYRAAEIVREWAEARYLVRRGAEKATGSVSLFPELDNAGRLEEWEEEGRIAPTADYV